MIELFKYTYILLQLCLIASFFLMLWKYLGLFMRYMLSSPIKWESFLEKPRLLFFGFGIVLSQVSKKLMVEKLDTKNIEWLDYKIIDYLEKGIPFIGILLSLYSCFILIFIWTKKFNTPFILLIKQKLFGGLQSTYYNNKLDLDEILKNLPEFECDSETFKNFLLGNKIDKPIICSYTKVELIRFVIIAFSISNEASAHKRIKTIISHNFIQKKHKAPYYLEPSSISDGFNSKRDKSDRYLEQYQKISSIFSDYQS